MPNDICASDTVRAISLKRGAAHLPDNDEPAISNLLHVPSDVSEWTFETLQATAYWNPQISLIDLPVEIRLMIYKFVFDEPGRIVGLHRFLVAYLNSAYRTRFSDNDETKTSIEHCFPPRKTGTALLRSSRNIHAEAHPVFMAQSIVLYHTDELASFLKRIGLQDRDLLKDLQVLHFSNAVVDYDLRWSARTIEQAKLLKRVPIAAQFVGRCHLEQPEIYMPIEAHELLRKALWFDFAYPDRPRIIDYSKTGKRHNFYNDRCFDIFTDMEGEPFFRAPEV